MAVSNLNVLSVPLLHYIMKNLSIHMPVRVTYSRWWWAYFPRGVSATFHYQDGQRARWVTSHTLWRRTSHCATKGLIPLFWGRDYINRLIRLLCPSLGPTHQENYQSKSCISVMSWLEIKPGHSSSHHAFIQPCLGTWTQWQLFISRHLKVIMN